VSVVGRGIWVFMGDRNANEMRVKSDIDLQIYGSVCIKKKKTYGKYEKNDFIYEYDVLF